jgi:molecular chaperone GrpE (heat shock protein)
VVPGSDEALAITETPVPVSAAVTAVDLAAAYSDAVVRCGKLESRLAAATEASTKAENRLLGELLVVADALEAIVAMDRAGPQKTAVAATLKVLRRTLARRGVERVEVVGDLADPELVDVDDNEPDASRPDETVIREIVPAYRRGPDVLRRGVVVVSCNSGSAR